MKKRIPNKTPNISMDKSFLELNSRDWRKPLNLNITSFKELLDFKKSNISVVNFVDQDTSINRPPDTYPVDTSLELAVDENFLYIWVIDRWKRLPLSNF